MTRLEQKMTYFIFGLIYIIGVLALTSSAPKINQGYERAPGIVVAPFVPDSAYVYRNDTVVARFFGPWEDEKAHLIEDDIGYLLIKGIENEEETFTFDIIEEDFFLSWFDNSIGKLKDGQYDYKYTFFIKTKHFDVTAGILYKKGKETYFERGGRKK